MAIWAAAGKTICAETWNITTATRRCGTAFVRKQNPHCSLKIVRAAAGAQIALERVRAISMTNPKGNIDKPARRAGSS